MAKINKSMNSNEQAVGRDISRVNQIISEQINALCDSIKADIGTMHKRKKSNRSYINPYGKIKSTDGMFLDSKQ